MNKERTNPSTAALYESLSKIASVIKEGGTLVLTGPNSAVSPGDPKFGATLEDQSGHLDGNAYGNDLAVILVQLVRDFEVSRSASASSEPSCDGGALIIGLAEADAPSFRGTDGGGRVD